jgi:hypothetical protein
LQVLAEDAKTADFMAATPEAQEKMKERRINEVRVLPEHRA